MMLTRLVFLYTGVKILSKDLVVNIEQIIAIEISPNLSFYCGETTTGPKLKLGWKGQISSLYIYKTVCRPALATPGLLIT